ncbi:MAG: nuclease-related domain-containing protein [Propionibacteriaceae bacterium]
MSAAAEFRRRHEARQERVAANHPRIGRLLLAVFDDPQSTQAWSVGAEGERLLGAMSASIARDSLRVLNDRHIQRSSANIDHLVVCPQGVFVVDAKWYRNARPELHVDGGLFRPRSEQLRVGGRDRTSLVVGVQMSLPGESTLEPKRQKGVSFRPALTAEAGRSGAGCPGPPARGPGSGRVVLHGRGLAPDWRLLHGQRR